MAIQVKNNLNGLMALKKLGIPELLINSFVSEGGNVKLTAKEFDLFIGLSHQVVPVSLDALQKLNAGTLPMQEKLNLSASLVKSMNELQAGVAGKEALAQGHGTLQMLPKQEGWDNVQVPPMSNLQPDAGSASAKLLEKAAKHAVNYGAAEENLKEIADTLNLTHAADGFPSLSKGAVATTGGGVAQPEWKPFDKSKMHTAAMVKLRDATQMYQPVYGTSSGSRYFVVAANKDLRIAARLESGTLSVRIEGVNMSKHASSIAEVGFTHKKADGYASLHLNVGLEMMVARKTLGAILAGLGVKLDTPMPELQSIVK